MKKWLEDFATSIARPPEESRLLGDPISTRTKMAIFGILFLVLLGIFIPATYSHFTQFEELNILAPLKKSDWIVAYQDVENFEEVCNFRKAVGPKCPAHIDHPFWNSPNRRSDNDRLQKNTTRKGQAIWYFAKYSKEQLANALKANANLFLLGVTSGDVDFWINGRHYLNLTKGKYFESNILNVNSDLLNKEMNIAVRIVHNTEFKFPDRFNGNKMEGFISSATRAYFLQSKEIQYSITPWLLLFINFIVALIFFLFWLSATKKPEYAALSIFVLTICFREIITIPHITEAIGGHYYKIKNMQLALEAYSVLWLGFTFARIKQSTTNWFFIYLSSSLAFSVGTSLFLPSLSEFKIFRILFTFVNPISYIFASLVCFTQLSLLASKKKLHYKKRLLRLSLFTTATILVSANHIGFINKWGMYDNGDFVFYRFMAGFLILALAYIVLTEYREQELIIEKTPLTEYHRYPYVGRKISGLLLAIDLKKSEKLYRKRALNDEKQTLVSQWRVTMIQKVKQSGALYLQSKGDEIFIFFDGEKFDDPSNTALNLLINLKDESTIFRKRKLALAQIEGSTYFNFRASLVEGDLRPVFDVVDGKEYPEWEEAGKTTPFVDCGRLLSIEKDLTRSDSNFLVTKEELVLKYSWHQLATLHNGEWKDKAHAKAFVVASLNLDSLQHESRNIFKSA